MVNWFSPELEQSLRADIKPYKLFSKKVRSDQVESRTKIREKDPSTGLGSLKMTVDEMEEGYHSVLNSSTRNSVFVWQSLEFLHNGGHFPTDVYLTSREVGIKLLRKLSSVFANYTLRVDLEDFDGSTAYAEYRDFSISGPDDFYRLHVGEYRDGIGPTYFSQNNQRFSTPDQDHDGHRFNCARDYRYGAWWYGPGCGYANLNGMYNGIIGKGVMWLKWKNDSRSYKHAAMKIRPQT
nr:hypothetical protein BaRGS_017377 [Batillaria attramentaria]